MTAWLSDGQGLDALRLDTVDVPAPGAGCALIAVHYAALNFSDVLMLRDKYQVRPPRPFIPGQELAGVVPQERSRPSSANIPKRCSGAFSNTMTPGSPS